MVPSPPYPSTPLLFKISRSYNSIHSIVTAQSLPSHHTTHYYSQHHVWITFIHCCAQPRLLHTRTLHFACSCYLFLFPPLRYWRSSILSTPSLHAVLNIVNGSRSFAAVPFPTSSTYAPAIHMSAFSSPHIVGDCQFFTRRNARSLFFSNTVDDYRSSTAMSNITVPQTTFTASISTIILLLICTSLLLLCLS